MVESGGGCAGDISGKSLGRESTNFFSERNVTYFHRLVRYSLQQESCGTVSATADVGHMSLNDACIACQLSRLLMFQQSIVGDK